MGLFEIKYNWYFIACIIIFVLIIIKSISTKRTSGRLAASEFRRKFFMITAIGLFIIFVYYNRDTINAMERYGSEGHLLAYGNSYDRSGVASRTAGSEEKQAPTAAASDVSKEMPAEEGFTVVLSGKDTLPDNLTRITPKEISASRSHKKYPPEKAIDDDVSSSWQVTIDDPNTYNDRPDQTEWLLIDFGTEQHIDYIVIYNGTPEPEDLFFENGRAESISFSDLSSDPKDKTQYRWTDPLKLKDGRDCQIIECRNLNTGKLYLNIDTMIAGSKYPELCIADIGFYSVK